ncbi:MAG: trypsin-like peptidase domain-containing protein, partial [Verrucomicrobiota bacterium]
MFAVFQRVCLAALIVITALFVYYLVIGPSSARYSIYKLAKAEPAHDPQLLGSRSDDQSRFAGPRLEPSDIPNLARLSQDYAQLVSYVQPAVVRLDTTIHERKPAVKYFEEVEEEMPDGTVQKYFRWIKRPELLDFDLEWETPRFGSGIFISEDGVLLTSNHVVQDVDTILVTTHDGSKYVADLIGADSTMDIAVLRVRNPDSIRFPVLNFANSDQVRTGELVVAFGSPYGLTGSVSQGMITGSKRRFEAQTNISYLQTDAFMDRGISGGPLTNVFGEVVGINTLIFTGQEEPESPNPQDVNSPPPSEEQESLWRGIGLALPSNDAIKSYEDLLRLGERVRPFLGVLFNRLTPETAELIGLEERSGTLVWKLEDDSPARGVLETGDVVLSIAGEPVDISTISGVMRNQTAGAPLELEIWRKSKAETVTVTLGEFRDVNQIARYPKAFESLDTLEEVEEAIVVIEFVERQPDH